MINSCAFSRRDGIEGVDDTAGPLFLALVRVRPIVKSCRHDRRSFDPFLLSRGTQPPKDSESGAPAVLHAKHHDRFSPVYSVAAA